MLELELIASKVDNMLTVRFHSAALFLTNALQMHDHMTPPDTLTAILQPFFIRRSLNRRPDDA